MDKVEPYLDWVRTDLSICVWKTTRLETNNGSNQRRERDSRSKNARDAADRAGKLMDALKGEKRKADVLKRKEWVTAQKKLNKQLRQAQRESEGSDIHLKIPTMEIRLWGNGQRRWTTPEVDDEGWTRRSQVGTRKKGYLERPRKSARVVVIIITFHQSPCQRYSKWKPVDGRSRTHSRSTWRV